MNNRPPQQRPAQQQYAPYIQQPQQLVNPPQLRQPYAASGYIPTFQQDQSRRPMQMPVSTPVDSRSLLAEIALLKNQLSYKQKTSNTTEEITLLHVKVDSLTEYSSTLESSVISLRRDNSRLQIQTAQCQSENEILVSQNQAYKREMADYEKQYSRERDAIFTRHVNELRLEKDRCGEAVRSNDTLNMKVKALELDLVDSFAHLDSMHSISKAFSHSQLDVSMNASLVATKQDELLRLKETNSDLTRRHDQQTSSWRIEIDEITKRCSLLQSDLCENTSMRISQISDFNEQIKALKQQLLQNSVSHEAEMESLKKRCEESSLQSDALREQVGCIEVEKKSLKKALSILNLNGKQAVSKAIPDTLAEVESLKSQFAQSQHATFLLNEKLSEMKTTNATLQASLDEFDAHITHIEAQYSALQKDNVGLKRLVDVKHRMLQDATGGSTTSSIASHSVQ